MNNEPTVLDYVKSKLFFWRGIQIEIPDAPQQDVGGTGEEFSVDSQRIEDHPILEPGFEVGATTEITQEPVQTFDVWPLIRLLLPIGLAYLAQLMLEPPNRSLVSGIVLYAIAAAWLVWAGWRGDWQLAERQVAYRLGWEDTSIRPVSLLLSVLLVFGAFIAFGGNRFNFLNLTLWVLSLICFFWAFWQTELESLRWSERLRQSWDGFLSEGIRFSPWTLFVLAAFAITVFFRLYMLPEVPGEMFSDHAEKLMDVSTVLEGEYRIFFPRNTGREAFQMYLTATMALIFDTGLSFMSLKLGTALAGIFTLPFISCPP